MKYRWDIDTLSRVCKESLSIRQVLITLDIIPAGGNYRTAKKYIKKYNIDTSHFTGKLWSKGKKVALRRPLHDYLSNKYPIQSNRLRQRLLREGVMSARCTICENTEWNGKAIPLELDHINGNHEDNTLANLRIICPNCHAQTSTYRGRNINKS